MLNEDYATKIARDWNAKHSGIGYITRFPRPPVIPGPLSDPQAGGRTILEYWIPAEDLAELSANIVGPVELVAEYHQDEPPEKMKET